MIRSNSLRTLVALGIAVVLPGVLFARPARQRSPRISLTVSAAVSIEDALEEVKGVYTREKPHVALTFNFGASGTLQIQIEQGAPVDVFISAAPQPMDALAAKGLLLPATRANLLENRLVLIVPKDSSGFAGFSDLARDSVKLVAMGDPRSVPAGEYARQVLTSLGIYDQVKRKAVLATDVRQVLAYVETGSADAGIVYATDAQISSRVKVVATAPPGSHERVVYPVAVLKNSRHAAEAREFVRYLLGPEAGAVFRKYGFTPAAR